MRGFTIIELMITLVVAAILLAIAIPSFTYLTVSNRLTTTANELVNRLSLARSDAIKRNTLISVAADGALSVVTPASIISPAITVPGSVNYGQTQALEVTQMGILQAVGATVGYSGLVADFNSSRISSNNHRCVYVTTGTVVTSCTDSNPCGGAGGGAPNATCR
jgi:type IV fimbrial biogenesis protein FimT